MYVVMLDYLKPMEDVERFTEVHRNYLTPFFEDGTFLVSGPKIPRTGGVIVVKGIGREKLMEIIENDPFHIEGIAEYKITEFNPLKHQQGLKDLL